MNKPEVISLMYHDTIENGVNESSGFPWPDAALYKLDAGHFDQHLQTIACADGRPILISDLPSVSARSWMITFDDGGVSAYTHIADRLEVLGWRGHFFIATDYIGAAGFMNRAQIRELHRRGHAIGSHSCSHPLRMASCSSRQIEREWSVSANLLSDLLGERVDLASIPGGQYSRQVAEAAAQAGVRALFTSEPTIKCEEVDGCLTLGRYAIKRWTTPQTAAAIASGKMAPRARQTLLWQAKKITKAFVGEYYLRLREAMTRRRTIP
ncbi:MAG: polysaccharide deacetylase family protein [Blastocatellales bacterium]